MATQELTTSGRRSDRRLFERGILMPLGLFLGTLALYLATLTDVHTFDALSYASGVDLKPWTEMFHPHHLAYGPLGILALKLARLVGYEGRAALPLQVVNVFAGALGVAIFFATIRRYTRRYDLALLASLLLGGSYAFWYYAVEIEVYTLATLFLLIALELTIRQIEAPSRRKLVLLGLAQGAAILFHQTNLLFCAPLAAALLVPADAAGQSRSAARRERLRGWWLYALVLALSVGLPYLYVGVGVSGFRSAEQFVAWMTEYARTGWWGGPITNKKWSDLGKGLTESLTEVGGGLLWLLLVGLLLLHLRRLTTTAPPLLAALLSWILVYGGFFLWWEPDNIEFWIASLPPALMLLALVLQAERRWAPGIWVAIMVATTVVAVNYEAIARRGDSRRDLQRQIVTALGERSGPADLLLVPDGLIELYLPYYEERYNYLSLNALLYNSGGSWEAACTTLRDRIETTLHAGAALLVADKVLHPPALLLERHGFTEQQVGECMAPYSTQLQPLPLPEKLPTYWRYQRAQERAEAGGWEFTHAPEGWKVYNGEGSRFEAGWRLTGGSALAIVGPLLELDAARYAAIEIRMASQPGARQAKLFYAGLDQQFSEERSLVWTLEPTTGAVTYRLALDQAPGWQGKVTRLRIDPLISTAAGEVRLEAIRLIARQ